MPSMVINNNNENLHPNQWQYQTPAPSKSVRKQRSVLHSKINETNKSTTKKQIRFRENSPHISGRLTQSIPQITNIDRGNHFNYGGLRHLAQVYHPPPPPRYQRYNDNLPSTHCETKQSLSFSNYMNFLLSPHSTVLGNSGNSNTNNARTAPHSLLLLHQTNSHSLHTATQLYSTLTPQFHHVESLIGKGKLIFRSDRDWKDLRMQNELMELVMGYEGKWLGLGLGVIVGEWGGWRVSLCLICTVD